MQKPATDKYSSANLVLKQKDEMGALLVGDCTSAVDKHILKPYKIKTIITFGQDSAPQKKQQDISYILYNVLDNKSQKIGEMFDPARKKGGVLVHCYTGISRSPSFVIAYLMRKKFNSYDDSKAFLKKQRSLIQPNDNFHRQLQSYWKVLLKRQQQERLARQNKQKAETKLEIQIQNNQSSLLSSNISNLSKRTFRGVKGAVRPAIRQNKSFDCKSIQQTAEKSVQKQVQQQSMTKQKVKQQSRQKAKRQQKNKEVKGVYSNKTKVL